MKWKIEYIKEVQRDLRKLDAHNRKIILKAIDKTAECPLPPPDGIGKPLGNHVDLRLSGYYMIKLRGLGYRVVYQLMSEGGGDEDHRDLISVCDDEAVYREGSFANFGF